MPRQPGDVQGDDGRQSPREGSVQLADIFPAEPGTRDEKGDDERKHHQSRQRRSRIVSGE